MKKAAALLLLGLFITASFVFMTAVLADTPADPPEFYFTRLLYSEGGVRGGFFGRRRSFTMPKPAPFKCPEFGGKDFFPIQGWGWATDYPGGDCKFMGGIHRLTGMHVDPNPNVIEIMDDDLFKFPFIYIVEPGGLSFSDKEAERLREYFMRGGFLHVDDFWGLAEKANFEAQIRKVFPDRPIEVLPLSHEVFHTFFDVNEVIQVPNVGNGCDGGPTWERSDDKIPRVYGISDDTGRLMVVVTYNTDLGDAWEYMDAACYPERFSGYAYRMGLNFMIYAMTH